MLSGTEKALKKRSMASGLAKGTFQRNTVAIKAGLAAMLEAKPDAVVMVGPYTPLATFIKEARAAGLKSQLATVSFVGTDNLVAEVGKLTARAWSSPRWCPSPRTTTCRIQRECREALAAQGGREAGLRQLSRAASLPR